MAEAATALEMGVGRRLEFIEFRLFWEVDQPRRPRGVFGVSVPRASKDLTLYQERAPGNMEYDTRAKRYVAAEHFVLRFLEPDLCLSRAASLRSPRALFPPMIRGLRLCPAPMWR
jgi:hypothetical protein